MSKKTSTHLKKKKLLRSLKMGLPHDFMDGKDCLPVPPEGRQSSNDTQKARAAVQARMVSPKQLGRGLATPVELHGPVFWPKL